MTENSTFSAAEAAVYDRQMRLWGVEAQKRLQNSHVFISGLTAMGSELVKNLVLSGMNVTMHDTKPVAKPCVESQFFFFEQDIGKNVSISWYFSVFSLALSLSLSRLRYFAFIHFKLAVVFVAWT
jgi:molybdopterin/thiamine biosynthesis adenylyltransferase